MTAKANGRIGPDARPDDPTDGPMSSDSAPRGRHHVADPGPSDGDAGPAAEPGPVADPGSSADAGRAADPGPVAEPGSSADPRPAAAEPGDRSADRSLPGTPAHAGDADEAAPVDRDGHRAGDEGNAGRGETSGPEPEDSVILAGARGRADAPSPGTCLTPAERVFPTWTDPTVRRASTLIGGPVGVHASVGRNRIVTPLRVALVMGIIALIVGWLAKSACIQTGANGELDQGGQKPWITGCYNDIVPLYSSRGLDDPSRNPYSYSWVDRGPSEAAGRVYPRSEVKKEGDGYVAEVAGTVLAVGTADLVGDEHSGYSQVVDGTLELAPPGAAADVHHLEYPVLTGYFMWGSAALTSLYMDFTTSTGILPVPLEVGAYFTITAILLGLLYLWAIASTARIARRRIWDVAIMCLAPLLMVQAFTNWDLLAIGCTAGAMAGWARKRSVLAGVLFGLGTAAKLYPALLLGPLLILCLRSGKLRQFWITLGAGVVAWLAVNLPILLTLPRAWTEFFTMNASRGPEWDSWYFLSTVIAPTDRWWSDTAGHATTLLNSLSLALFLIACAAIAWLALAARRRPRFAQLAFLVVVAFLLTNKVFSPQYSLWILPLVVLALPRWRRVLAWEFAEVAVWYLLMLSFDTDPGKNLPIEPFAIAAVVRDALLIALAVRVIREILHPAWDLVRIAGDDDPSGGVLEDAEDRFTIPSLPVAVRRWRAAGDDRAPDDEVPEPADAAGS